MEGGNPSLQSSPSNDQGGVNIDGQLRQAEVSTSPEYYNPNPWVRILGRANESEIDIDKKISKALINSGAMISMMSKGYCDEHGYEIQPLDWCIPIEGSGGEYVPYLGYVEVRMQILGISSFDQHVLMLISHTTTHYHKRVPLQVGSQIIDQVTNCITEEELKSLSQSWKLAYVSTVLSKSSQVGDQEFDLDQVKGKSGYNNESDNSHFSDSNSESTHKSHWTSKTCPCAGGTIPKMQKYIHSRQYLRVNTRGIRCSDSASKFIGERYYFRTSH